MMKTRWGGTRLLPALLLTTFICKRTKYRQVFFKKKKKDVHRLVALAFLPKPNFPKPQVNHKNGNRGDARLNNLEWVTAAENAAHSFRVLGRKPPNRKPVVSTRISDGKVTWFESGAAAVRVGGFNGGCISEVCNGLAKHHAGHRWAYGAQNGVKFQ